jgi:16S rRNA (guanine966-N2)-methyltransferase
LKSPSAKGGIRVIAGTCRGRRLSVPRGLDTRPTTDRTREAIFNILGGRVQGAAVLDLFAGTGAMAIEAVSRGARSAVCIDLGRSALAVIDRNIAACGLGDRVRTVAWDAGKNLRCLTRFPDPFDLVFMDPPYGRGLIAVALRHLAASGRLAPDATVVVEHDAGETPTSEIGGYAIADTRRYGKTLVTFLTPMV